jgi:hypothetical protein
VFDILFHLVLVLVLVLVLSCVVCGAIYHMSYIDIDLISHLSSALLHLPLVPTDPAASSPSPLYVPGRCVRGFGVVLVVVICKRAVATATHRAQSWVAGPKSEVVISTSDGRSGRWTRRCRACACVW